MFVEAEIVDLLETRARLVRDKHAEGALRYYAPEVVNFDLAPPLAYRGPEATDPMELRSWFESWDGAIDHEFEQLEVRGAGDIAFAHGLLHLTGKRTDGSYTDIWARITVCFQRRAGEWKIVHDGALRSFTSMC